MGTTNQPVFKVTVAATDPATRLVRAKGPAAAFDHVAIGLITVERATPDDIVAIAKAGASIEEAGE